MLRIQTVTANVFSLRVQNCNCVYPCSERVHKTWHWKFISGTQMFVQARCKKWPQQLVTLYAYVNWHCTNSKPYFLQLTFRCVFQKLNKQQTASAPVSSSVRTVTTQTERPFDDQSAFKRQRYVCGRPTWKTTPELISPRTPERHPGHHRRSIFAVDPKLEIHLRTARALTCPAIRAFDWRLANGGKSAAREMKQTCAYRHEIKCNV